MWQIMQNGACFSGQGTQGKLGAFPRQSGVSVYKEEHWSFPCVRFWVRKLNNNPAIVSCSGSGGTPTTHTEPQTASWENGGCGDHTGVTVGLPSVIATIKARLGVWPVVFRHLCMMMTLEQSKTTEDSMWLVGLIVPFFVVIFYVISPTIAQTIAGPRCRGEQLSCLMVAHFYMRLQARPRITVQYITVVTRLWQRFHLSSSGLCSSD